MNFSDYEARFVKQNRLLWTILAVSTFMFSVILFINFAQKRYFVISSGDILKTHVLATDVCKESFVGIVSGNPNKHLVAQGVMDILEDNPFEMDLTEILKNRSIGPNKCRLVIKSGKTLRSFVIGLIENEDFPFHFKLNQIDEIEFKGDSI